MPGHWPRHWAGQPGMAVYEHFGFRNIGDLDMPKGAPVLTGMWRAPTT
jgi:hypothetical protein